MYKVSLNDKIFCIIESPDKMNRDQNHGGIRFYVFEDINNKEHLVDLGTQDRIEIHEMNNDEIRLMNLQQKAIN